LAALALSYRLNWSFLKHVSQTVAEPVLGDYFKNLPLSTVVCHAVHSTGLSQAPHIVAQLVLNDFCIVSRHRVVVVYHAGHKPNSVSQAATALTPQVSTLHSSKQQPQA
jgi:hypothetical protein